MKFLIFISTIAILGVVQGNNRLLQYLYPTNLTKVSLLSGEKCQNPKVQASSYTPSDAQVLTHIAFVAEFSLTCSNGAANVPLYADLKGALVPVVRSQDAGGRFVPSYIIFP